ncbi:hypothetical protein FOA52_014505 [Chlamydomonas sp. UWO 241]|nr:hypothetical protein FOA52_014505 [Chlamydomonas sp. UWO 241]
MDGSAAECLLSQPHAGTLNAEEDDLLEYMDVDEQIDIVDDGSGHDHETNSFDCVVGRLEAILMDSGFESARTAFCKSNCVVFEEGEENKLAYTAVFQTYTQLIESHVEKQLVESVPGFDMADFMLALTKRKDELSEDVFELMVSFGDFPTFKELMLSYRREAASNTSSRLTIDVVKMKLHSEAQEEGDLRPDLVTGLLISPTGRLGV